MRLREIQTNFSSGELDPLMAFRVDTGAYQNGVKKLRNAVLYSAGGASRRPGTEDNGALTGLCQLVPFEFSDDERYVLAFSNGRLDVYDEQGVFVTNVTSGCSWSTSNLFQFTWSQIADTMIIAHRDFYPQIVQRTGATTFTVSDFAFREATNGNKIYQPYFKFADDAVTISVSAVSGTGVTITANSAVFTSDYVGLRIRWAQVEIEITGFTSTTVLTGDIKGTLEGELLENPYRTTSGSNVVEVTHVAHGFASGDSVTISGSSDTGGITAANLNGARTITVVDDNRYTFVAGGAATESIDGGGPAVKFSGANLPTRNWDEPVFSVINGYPGAVTFHEGRLWFGGSGGVPDGLWSSKIFDFYNFAVDDGQANDSIQVTLGSDDISNIRHLVSNGDLQIFTATGDFYAQPPRDAALTPSNIVVRRQTPYGAARVRPKVFDGATIYLQASQTGLREFLFNEATQRYASTDLNVLSSHLIDEPYNMSVLLGNTERSEQYALLINQDGTMAVFHSSRAEQLAAWALWDLGGDGNPEISSCCVLGENVWYSHLRNGSYRLMKQSESVNQPLDGMVNYTNGSATTTWVVDSQFYNNTVSVRSGNYYLGDYEVDGSGNMTIDVAVDNIDVGYGCEFEIETLPPNLQLQTGSYQGMPKRIGRVIVGLLNSYAMLVDGSRLIIRNTNDDMSQEPTPATGSYEFYLLGYSRDPTITIAQDEQQPVTVLGMNMEVSV